MNTKIASLVVNAEKHRVFSYLSDLKNLPEWATEFCRELKIVDGQYRVETPVGEIFAKVQADEKTGVIDMYAGPTETELGIFPIRVIELPDNSSIITFTLFQTPDVNDQEFQGQYESLKKELDNVKRIFSVKL